MKVDSVLFDLGGTVEDIWLDYSAQKKCIGIIQQLLCGYSSEFNVPPEEFAAKITAGFEDYKKWSTENRIELSPDQIWGDWCCRNFPNQRRLFVILGEMLADIWETLYFVRNIKPEAEKTFEELKKRGYNLGVISNTTSIQMPMRLLKMYGADKYFDCMLLSSVEKVRKPEAAMFTKAAEILKTKPENCVYIGDQIAKDVCGARNAGYRAVVLINSQMTSPCRDNELPDAHIENLAQLPLFLESLER